MVVLKMFSVCSLGSETQLRQTLLPDFLSRGTIFVSAIHSHMAQKATKVSTFIFFTFQKHFTLLTIQLCLTACVEKNCVILLPYSRHVVYRALTQRYMLS